MTTSGIVTKLWNLSNVLEDDGVTYHQYVTEFTYLLFLKMATPSSTLCSRPRSFWLASRLLLPVSSVSQCSCGNSWKLV
jgi:hypothetical protein